MANDPGPTVRRRQLATLLRAHRLAAGMTASEVADRLLVSVSKISRLETGQRSPGLRDIRDLCQLYQISDEEAQALMAMAKESRERGWWQAYDSEPEFDTFVGMEGSAKMILEFGVAELPALLQTREYAGSFYRQRLPDQSSVIKQSVELTIRRQEANERYSLLKHHAIIDEAAVRRIVGGVAVMREQVQHLLQLITLPRIALQILPFSAGAHTGMGSSNFTALAFEMPDGKGDELSLNPVVYVENLAHPLLLTQAEDVKQYFDTHARLSNQALTSDESADLLRSVVDQLS
jgi:transcriptional regulator with XRE-family HTH domain